ncbi:hypothetical protein BDAP_000219 [Binucleata daphniae]
MKKAGTLTKLTLTNFQTFKNATFDFSSNLNFIAAPNGSGKSTITNAISFLCLGTPSTLARNMQLKEFIRFGSTTATIEGVFLANKHNDVQNNISQGNNSIINYTSQNIDDNQENSTQSAMQNNTQNNTQHNIDNRICTITLKRVITEKDALYYINGLKVKKQEYKNVIDSFNIDVSNMTQFLPQDRVSEFSKMSSEEVFKQVINSSGLRIKENEMLMLENNIKKSKKDLENYNLKMKGTFDVVKTLKQDADRAKEAVQKQKLIRLIKYKTKGIEYNQVNKTVNQDKKSIDVYKSEMKKNDENIKFIEEEIQKIKKDEKNKKLYDNFECKTKDLIKIENFIDEITKEINLYNVDLNYIDKKKEKRKNEIEEYKERKREYEKKYSEIKKVDKNDDKIKEKVHRFIKEMLKNNKNASTDTNKYTSTDTNKQNVDENSSTNDDENKQNADERVKRQKQNDSIDAQIINELKKIFTIQKFVRENNQKRDLDLTKIFENLIEYRTNEKSKYKAEERNKKEESMNLKKQYEFLEKQKLQITETELKKLENFRKTNKDAYEAILWLRKNKEHFRGEVIEPSYLHTKIKNNDYIEEVETLLPRNALNSFICLNSLDFDKFNKKIKDEMRLNVNVILYEESSDRSVDNNNNLGSFYSSYTEAKTIANKIGFEYICIDLIEARKEYINIFCNLGNLHRIPITKKRIDDTHIFMNSNYKKMIINKKYLEKRVSKYNKNDYTIINSDCKRKNVFEMQIKESDVMKIEVQMKEINNKRESKSMEMKNIYTEIEMIENDITKIYLIKEEHETIMKENAEYENLKVRYTKNIEKYANLTNKLENENDIEEEKIKIKEKIKKNKEKLNDKMRSVDINFEDFIDVYKKMRTHHVETANIEKELNRLTKNKQELKVENIMYEDELKKAMKEYETNKEKRNILKKSYKEEEKEVYNLYEIDCNQDNKDLNDAIQIKKQVIQNDLNKLSNDHNCLKQQYQNEKVSLSMFSCDLNAIEQYKMKNKSLNEIKNEIEKIEKNIKQEEKKLKIIRIETINKINYLLKPVSERFGYFFSEMKCEGKIEFEYENLPYNNWKINILVRFRENEYLTKLSSGRQSGGEKSVSTILFLLALQNLSLSPFKLVDEINQGMDRNNEKIVSNLLIKISEEKDAPQFFIITPKIVSGIEFGSKMKVIIIFACNSDVKNKLKGSTILQ